jgi:uncharacterized integral membrane protein
MRMLRRILAAVVFVGLFWVVWQFVGGNSDPVDIDLIVLRVPLPLWVALLGSFGIGALCAGASLVYSLAKRSFATRRYRKQVAGLESEIHQLRNLPLAAAEGEDGAAPAGGARLEGARGGPPLEGRS